MFWELKMLFGSLVELHICLCFSPLEKTVLKSWLDSSSIASYLSSLLSFFLSQSRQHLDTWWIDWESFWPLHSFSTPCGSIKRLILLLVFLFLDSFSTQDLSMLLFLTPAQKMSQHHLDTSSIEIYWGLYLSSLCNPPVIFSISFSIDCCFLSQTLSFSPQICSTRFLQASPSFSSHVKLLFSCISCIHAFWGFWGFSKLMRYCWNFGLVFEDLILKTSCIALHLHYNSIIMHLDVCNLFVWW